MQTIFGTPVRYPRRAVSAYVGAFASDYLGDYVTPAAAIRAAQAGGYRLLSVMYRNGEADTIDLTPKA